MQFEWEKDDVRQTMRISTHSISSSTLRERCCVKVRVQVHKNWPLALCVGQRVCPARNATTTTTRPHTHTHSIPWQASHGLEKPNALWPDLYGAAIMAFNHYQRESHRNSQPPQLQTNDAQKLKLLSLWSASFSR